MNFLSLLVAVVYLKWIGVEAGPTGVQTVFSKIRESTQTKCIYVTEWFKIEPDYLRQCPRIEVVTSVKLAEIDSNKFAFLCNLFLKYFETLCDANSRSNNTPPNKPPMEVKDSSTVCTELLKYQHDSNLTNTRCNALCTDLATEKAEPICLGMAQLAAATYTIQSTNPEQPMRSEPHNVESEQPVRSDAPQLDNTAVRETTPKPQTMPVDKTPETLKVDKVTQQQNGEGEAVVANVKNKEQEGREDTPNNAKLNNVQVDESDNAQETMVESQGDDGHVKLAQGKTSLQEVANGVESPRAFEEEADIDGDTQGGNYFKHLRLSRSCLLFSFQKIWMKMCHNQSLAILVSVAID